MPAIRFAILLLLLALVSCNAANEVAETGGVFVPGEVSVDYADRDPSGSVHIGPTFVNRGSVPLRITGFKTTCGCTKAGDLRVDQIGPGEQVSIPLDVEPPAYGSLQITVTLETSPPSQNATLRITASGEIPEPPFVVELPHLIHRLHTPGTPFQGTVQFACVEYKGDPWIAGAQVHGTHAGLRASVRAESNASPYATPETVRRQYELVVEAEDGNVPPHFEVVLRSADGTALPASVRFHVDNTPLLRIVPEVVSWNGSSAEVFAPRTVILMFNEMYPWSIEIDSDVPEWLHVDLEKPATNSYRRCGLRLELKDRPNQSLDHDLLLEVRSPSHDATTYTLPVRVAL